MKTATVRELRNEYARLIRWVTAGEEIAITRRGKTIARLVPEKSGTGRVDWSQSPAVTRNRSQEPKLTAAQSRSALAESQGGC